MTELPNEPVRPPNEAGLTWAELDELADYAAGVLTGAPAERVAEVIRADQRWAAAHAALTAADPVVRAALHAAAEVPPSLPDDVAARLDAALSEAIRPGDVHPTPRLPVSAVPATSRPPSRTRTVGGPTRPGRSRRTLLTRVAAAFLVLGAVGGVTAVARQWLAGDGAFMAAEDARSGDFEGAAPAVPPGLSSPMAATAGAEARRLEGTALYTSGTDYRRETLPTLANQTLSLPAPTLRADDAQTQVEGVDAALSDLALADRLDECLTAVGHLHPGPVVAVDFARFEGQPAAILVVQQHNVLTVVAVGPGCGTSGADVLATVEVS